LEIFERFGARSEEKEQRNAWFRDELKEDNEEMMIQVRRA
jgi:hypothetical protein